MKQSEGGVSEGAVLWFEIGDQEHVSFQGHLSTELEVKEQNVQISGGEQRAKKV